ncbi:MFS transporter [Pararobbsia silviterrae]|uniref:MFS transporter n=1 Tax=Pararobbsia silviterrae TaxID=1792498 RepID=A0A494XM82_9BURK|nr:MFS transporter [Pararobbsia silviterrae]RKP51797.1 MFS transporter [Pararobbsia silviterrae]
MSTAQPAVPESSANVTVKILTFVFFTFIVYLTIGLPLAVLPGFVHQDLGMNSVFAGLVISVQYVATLASRPVVGRLCDDKGAKLSVSIGLVVCLISGLFYLGTSFVDNHSPMTAFTVLLVGRLLAGVGESLVGTGSIQWAIGAVGFSNTSRVISWNGIATYAGLAGGAPLGVVLVRTFGFATLGVTVIALAIAGLALASRQISVPATHGERLGMHHVLRRVINFGVALALGATGFGVIATFITLYYASRGWSGAAFALTVFSLCFCGARFLFVDTIARYGGYKIACISLVSEAIGLALLGLAPNTTLALLGAGLAGIGFALVFPALGVAAVATVPLADRGAALGVYSAFADLSLGITGPLAGIVAHHFGFSGIYVAATGLVLIGAGLVAWLWSKARERAATSMLN